MCSSHNVQWPEFFVAEDEKPNLMHEHLLEVYGEAMQIFPGKNIRSC
jgi:hypothetical protein